MTVALFGDLSKATLIVDTLRRAIWAFDGNLGAWNGLNANINSKEIHMKRSATLVLFAALSAVVPTVSFGQAGDLNKKDSSGMDMKGMDMQSMDMQSMDMKSMDMKDMGMNKNAAATTHKGVGVVKDINAADGVVTLVHEPIKSLNWPAMTMGFKLKDKSLMNKIKPGDKVEFTLVQSGKEYLITGVK